MHCFVCCCCLQMALAQGERGKQAFGSPVVLLTDRGKADIDAEVCGLPASSTWVSMGFYTADPQNRGV